MKVKDERYIGKCLRLSVFLLLSVLIFQSCNSNKKHHKISRKAGSETFAKALSDVLESIDTTDRRGLKTIREYMHFAYQQHEYASFWLINGKPSDFSGKVLTELDSIQDDGIAPERYHLTELKQLYLQLKDSTYLAKQIAFDTTLSYAYLRASHDLLIGIINPKNVDSLWYHVNDSSWNGLSALTGIDSQFIPLDSFRSKMMAYHAVRDEYRFYSNMYKDTILMKALKNVQEWDEAKPQDSVVRTSIKYIIKRQLPWVNEQSFYKLVRAYQYYMNVNVSGRVDSFTRARLLRMPEEIMRTLGDNMERMRWMQQDIGNLYIVVDVPLMELFFRKNDSLVMHMNIVVGKPERQTPSLYANMANVVINPPWGVPPTIMKKDVLPGILKNGKKYLKKKDLQVYNRHGEVVDPGKLNSKNYKNYIIKQAPGDDNALGYVKFNLPNKWDIYLHDTPHRTDFKRRNRFLSSGCIRLEKPLDMAIYILAELENRRYTPERLDSVIDTHKTRWEVLKTKIPVHIVYLTTFMDSAYAHVRFARDIYHRDSSLEAVLTKTYR